MAALRIAAGGAVRRDRPAASEASRAGGRNGSASAVPPRHRRSGIVAVVGRGHAGLPVSRPRSARLGSEHAGGLPRGGVPRVRRGPARRAARFGSTSTGSTWSAGRSATCGRSAWPNTIRRASVGSCSSAAGRSSPMSACRVSSGCWPRRSARSSSGCRSARDRLLSILRDSGHAASLEDGRVADELVAWRLAASQRHGGDASRA